MVRFQKKSDNGHEVLSCLAEPTTPADGGHEVRLVIRRPVTIPSREQLSVQVLK
jgi:hypothetical protein